MKINYIMNFANYESLIYLKNKIKLDLIFKINYN